MRKTAHLVEQLSDSNPRLKQCYICKGSKMLCGKTRCPLLMKYYHSIKKERLMQKDVQGLSPPAVFVGRYGYPKVAIGPLVPPVKEDTEIYDMPERWIDLSTDDIVDFRASLIRGKKTIGVEDVGNSYVQDLQEVAMAAKPLDMDAHFSRRPSGGLHTDSHAQPYGPSAPLIKFDTTNPKVDQKVEKAYYDVDMLAADAVKELYKSGIPVSKLQRSFSVGSFGVGKRRKLVPTRWSITAVDDTISKGLRERIKEFPTIDEFRVYESYKFSNRFIILMLPRAWSYELVEAWYPNTIWNPSDSGKFMVSSHEYYEGRKKYAEIGGCFYASRLAIGEKLMSEGRQAEAIVLREAHPGYIMPLGVWHVRENVRNALRQAPSKFDSFNSAMDHITKRFRIDKQSWIKNSKLLDDASYQKRLEEYA